MAIRKYIRNKKYGYVCPNCGEHFTLNLDASITISSDRFIADTSFDRNGYIEIGDEKNGVYFYDSLINPLCDKCDCHFAQIDILIYEAVCKFVKAGMKTAYCCSGHQDSADGNEQVIQMIKEAKEKNSFFLYDPNAEEIVNTLDPNEYDERVIDASPVSCYIDFVRDDKINKTLHKIIDMYNFASTKYIRDRFVIKLFDETDRYGGVSKDGKPISEIVVAFSRSVYINKPQYEKEKTLEVFVNEANMVMLDIAKNFEKEYKNG